ncbi:MAG: serine--tRNA ligase, partial [Pseudomonadota bacterium]|nr:serine--tRNA ligase [Pseudomonadota bacterium]
MHDLRAIRENPDAYAAGWRARGVESDPVPEILALDERLRAAQTALQAAQSRRNELSKQIGAAKGRKDEAEAARLMAEVEALKAEMAAHTEAERALGEQLRDRLAGLPNLPAPGVPEGEDESANLERRRWGEPRAIAAPKDHADLGEALGLMDFEAAARMSGARFVVLKGQLARLERALAQFMLDLQTGEGGYTEVSPPVLVRDQAMFGTGQLPKFVTDLFAAGALEQVFP